MRRRSAGAGHTARTLHAATARTACIEIVVLAGSTRRFLAEIAQVIDELQGYVPSNREVGTVLDVRALHRTAETRILVEQVVHLITENYAYDELTASNAFYNSEVYALLEQEETKLWHFSPLTLFNMYDEEKKTGSFVLPEEA